MKIENRILLIELLKTVKDYYFVVLPFLFRYVILPEGKNRLHPWSMTGIKQR